MSRVSRKTIDRFQYTWVTMIGKIYELIVEYLRKDSDKNLLTI